MEDGIRNCHRPSKDYERTEGAMTEQVDKDYNFTKQVNSDQLTAQLNIFCAQVNTDENGNIQLVRIDTVGDLLTVWFNQILSQNAETQLNDLINNYVLVEDYIPSDQQAQIDKLIGYLNNENMTIASIARAVIVLNIAPKLGPDLISTINDQISAKLGV